MPRPRALFGRVAEILVLAALAAAPAAARAQDDEPTDESPVDPDARARELYENGAILYEEGRYDDAVVAFAEAYRLSERPALLYNIANAQERAGKWSDAMDTLGRYRAFAPADEREVLDRRIRNIERRIQETKSERPPRPAEPAPAALPAPGARAAPAAPTMLRPLPIGLAGAGIVGFGAAIGLGVASEDARAQAEDACREVRAGTYCTVAAAQPLGTHVDTALAADIATVVGVLGLGSGVAIGLVGPGGPLQAVGTASVVVGPSSVALTGRF